MRGQRDSSHANLQIYLQEINQTALLTFQEERQLAERIKSGDPYAREHLVKANLRLVVKIARDYLNKGLSLEDLIEEGNLGLMRASESFDGNMQTRFSTYASYWIKQSIRRAVINQTKPIRLPAHMVTLVAKWRRVSKKLAEKLGRPAQVSEVAEALKINDEGLVLVLRALEVNALAQVFEAEDAYPGADILTMQADPLAVSPDEEAEDSELREQLLAQLEEMHAQDERKASILKGRFGIGNAKTQTLKELGESFGISRHRVRKIQGEGLAELACSLGFRGHLADEVEAAGQFEIPAAASPIELPASPNQPKTKEEASAAVAPPTDGTIVTPAASKARKADKAAKPRRRRYIDPATCDRLQTPEEIELGNAMMDFGRRIGRAHLTSREILSEADRALSYRLPQQKNGELSDSAVAEFAHALAEYKEKSRRMFPTWSEVLELMTALGYSKAQRGDHACSSG